MAQFVLNTLTCQILTDFLKIISLSESGENL